MTAFPNGKLHDKKKESAIPNYQCFFTKKENTLIHSASKVLSYSILTKKYFIPFHFPIPLQQKMRDFNVLTKILRSILSFPLLIKITLHGLSLQSFLQSRTTMQSKDCLCTSDVGIFYRKNRFKYQASLLDEPFAVVCILTFIFCLSDKHKTK